jgi:hypothetical protein
MHRRFGASKQRLQHGNLALLVKHPLLQIENDLILDGDAGAVAECRALLPRKGHKQTVGDRLGWP